MEHVQEFIRNLCDAMFVNDFKYVCIYMDEDFKSAEHFTVSIQFILFSLTIRNICLIGTWQHLLWTHRFVYFKNLEFLKP